MKELETRVLDTIRRADILIQKQAQTTTESQTEAVKELTQAYNDAATAAQNLAQSQAASDDEVAENSVSDDDESVHNEVLEDLRLLAKAAIEEGDLKLAYRIERTIDEITEPKILCS